MRKSMTTIRNDTEQKQVRTSVLLSQTEWLALKKIQLAKEVSLRDIIKEFIKTNKIKKV